MTQTQPEPAESPPLGDIIREVFAALQERHGIEAASVATGLVVDLVLGDIESWCGCPGRCS